MPSHRQTLPRLGQIVIFFISDLHLTANRPATVHRFLNFLATRANEADAVYILGDLFDAYIGDDNPAWPFDAIRQSIRRLTDQGTRVFVQQGNRDFLLGARFGKETGATLLGDYAIINLYGTLTLLTHGDLLCTDDVQYQSARQRIRTKAWKAHALSRPLWMRQLYARWYRFRSGRNKSAKSREIMDVNQDSVIETMRQHAVTRLIHGHTHRPAVHEFTVDGQAAQRFVLPEWAGQEWVLRWDEDGYQQEVVMDLNVPSIGA